MNCNAVIYLLTGILHKYAGMSMEKYNGGVKTIEFWGKPLVPYVEFNPFDS